MTHKTIQLTKGLSALVDAEDLDIIQEHSWAALKTKRPDKFYAVSRIETKFVYMHHLILGSNRQVDHRNGNGLDNRRGNLRFVTTAQNQMNKNKWIRECSSKHKGVSFRAGRSKGWYAYIIFAKKQISLGYFSSELDAAHAYNEAATKYFGEFANLNILAEDKLAEGHLELVTTPRREVNNGLLVED